MWIVFIVGLMAAIALARIARRFFPEAYGAVNAIAWGIEGLFWAIAIVAAIYQSATGRLF